MRDVAVVVARPSAEWSEGLENARESVSHSVAPACFVSCRGLAMRAMVPADVGAGLMMGSQSSRFVATARVEGATQ